MVAGLALPVSIGTLVSQCAEAMRIARSFGRRRPSAFQASPAAPGWRACIGEPWEMNTLGSGFMNSESFHSTAAGTRPMRPVCRLAGFLLRVHDEGAVAGDRLVDRLAAHGEQPRIGLGLDLDLVAGALEHHQLLAAGGLGSVALYAASKYEKGGGPPLAKPEARALAGTQLQIEQLDRRAGARRAFRAFMLAREYAHRARIGGKTSRRKIGRDQPLITWRGHFQLGRQVDPQLQHLETAAAAGGPPRVGFLLPPPPTPPQPLPPPPHHTPPFFPRFLPAPP